MNDCGIWNIHPVILLPHWALKKNIDFCRAAFYLYNCKNEIQVDSNTVFIRATMWSPTSLDHCLIFSYPKERPWYWICWINRSLSSMRWAFWWSSSATSGVSHVVFLGPYLYSDVIMSTMASQITSLTIVYSTVYSGADQRKNRSSVSLAFMREIHRWPVIFFRIKGHNADNISIWRRHHAVEICAVDPESDTSTGSNTTSSGTLYNGFQYSVPFQWREITEIQIYFMFPRNYFTYTCTMLIISVIPLKYINLARVDISFTRVENINEMLCAH